MKHLALFSSLLGAVCLAVPVTGWSDDHHHWSGGGGRGGVQVYVGSRPYCSPGGGVGFRHYPYRYGAPYYGYGYGFYPGYSYYSGPSVDLSYTTDPGNGYYYRGDSPSNGDSQLAEDVQRALAKRGYYHGAIDGDVGPGTRGAIREYQYRNHLEVTGRIDLALLRALGVE